MRKDHKSQLILITEDIIVIMKKAPLLLLESDIAIGVQQVDQVQLHVGSIYLHTRALLLKDY